MGHPHPKIVCHRGVKTFAPENTPLAIDLAIGLGFNIVEIDVRQTKDGVLEDVLEDELENWIVGETEDGHMPLVKKPQGA